MPEYSHIQTYVKCNQNEFRHILNEFVMAISPLGFYEPQLVEDLNQLEWEVEDDGSTSVGGGATTQLLSIGDVKLNVRPFLMGWTPEVIPELSDTWLELSLLLHTEEIEEGYESGVLKETMKPVVWMLLKHISDCYSKTETFFTNQLTNGIAWESSLRSTEGIWTFDAAIIPKHIVKEYLDIDEQLFYFKKNKEKLWLARKTVWTEEPWSLN